MAAEGQSGAQKIARLKKGDTDRTAQHADVMNEIIDAVNKMLALTVSPSGAGKFIWADANGVLDLGGPSFDFPIPEDEAKTYVWFAEFVDGAWDFSWKETTECP